MGAFRFSVAFLLLPLSAWAESGVLCPYEVMESSREPALLAAIAARPDDPAAVRALAGYLAERGSPRGELMQTSLALAELQRPGPPGREDRERERQLKQRRDELGGAALAEWAGRLAPGTKHKVYSGPPATLEVTVRGATLRVSFDRWGMPSSLTASGGYDFAGPRPSGREALASVDPLPIRSLSVHPASGRGGSPFRLDGIEGTALAQRLVSVRFVGPTYDPGPLAEHSSAFPQLREIEWEAGGNGSTDLAPFARLPTLETLSLHAENRKKRFDFAAMAAPAAPRLTTVSVHGEVNGETFGHWLRSPAVSELRSLVVDSEGPRDWQAALAQSRQLGRVEYLQTKDLTAAELAAILRSPHLPKLKTISVEHLREMDEGTKQLLREWKAADRSRGLYTMADWGG